MKPRRKCARLTCLAVMLIFLPTVLFGGTCILLQKRGAASSGPVITYDVCSAGAPGAISVDGYTGAICDSVPAVPILNNRISSPAPGKAVASANPGETFKPPQTLPRA